MPSVTDLLTSTTEVSGNKPVKLKNIIGLSMLSLYILHLKDQLSLGLPIMPLHIKTDLL